MKESQFQKKVIDVLKANNIWYVKYWAGSKFTVEGVPDILACIDGVFHGIELKNDANKESKLQAYNLDLINRNEGEGYVLRPTKVKNKEYPQYDYYGITFDKWKEEWFR